MTTRSSTTTSTAATDETAVVPVPDPTNQPRQYLRIRPSAEPLSRETVYQQVRRLHHLTQAAATRKWHHRLGLSNPKPPAIECLLVSDGRADTDLQYYLGIEDPQALDSLERTLRQLYPDSYEFDRTVWHPDHLIPRETASDAIRALEFRSLAQRSRDWQTPLQPFLGGDDDEQRVPLAAVVETMAATPVPMLYQVLLRPKPDWSGQAELRRRELAENADTMLGYLRHRFFDDPRAPIRKPHPENKRRLTELDAKNPYESFDVNARAIAVAPTEHDTADAKRAIDELASALGPIGRTAYQIIGRPTPSKRSRAVLERIRNRTFRNRTAYGSRAAFWARTARSTIVADPTEAPNFFLLDGSALTAAGTRSLAPTPGERTTISRPTLDQLASYQVPGLTLGGPLTEDGQPDAEPIALPPALQPLHAVWFGKTGSGKTTSLVSAILDNHAATDGASILIDPKGDGMATDYLRAHYARFGHLDDVYYFDCSKLFPAFSFFDIRDELDAGVSRTTAVEDKVDHTVELLIQFMGRERYERAVRSPDVVRYLVKAAFDPISGADAFSQRELTASALEMKDHHAPPPVANADLEQALAGVLSNRTRTFEDIMGGVETRIGKLTTDDRLGRIFNHVPDEGDPHFDLADVLDRNVVVIFDMGELRDDAQRALTLVVLSNLWTALRRRVHRAPANTTHPLVNLYLEEAASVAVSDLLQTLLAQARGFGCSVTLSMQFPAQLATTDEGAYAEVLNNVSTIVTGNVPVDRQLAERFATDDMDAIAVGNRIRALSRGEWLVKLPAGFGDIEPRPFTVASMPLPPGHPDGESPLTTEEHATFDAALETTLDRTLREAGLTLSEPSPADQDNDEAEDPTELRVDSVLPHTRRLPPTVRYLNDRHALECTQCANRYDPSFDGMLRAIECCSSLDEVDRDDIPVCDAHVKRTPEELADDELTLEQSLFLQVVYNAQQGRYDPLEYDLRRDSMLRLQEYVGIDSAEIEDLIETHLLTKDTDRPHRLYTVTPSGRAAIGESYREGVDYGHGKGDLEESSPHVLGVQLAIDLLTQEYVADPDSSVVEAAAYYDIGENQRIDAVGLDENGDIIVTVEVERVNHDIRRAVPEDFDKMAACHPDEAIWIVLSHSEGHDVLEALNDPLDGEPRVTTTYSRSTPVQLFRIDEPGMTTVHTVEQLLDRLEFD